MAERYVAGALSAHFESKDSHDKNIVKMELHTQEEGKLFHPRSTVKEEKRKKCDKRGKNVTESKNLENSYGKRKYPSEEVIKEESLSIKRVRISNTKSSEHPAEVPEVEIKTEKPNVKRANISNKRNSMRHTERQTKGSVQDDQEKVARTLFVSNIPLSFNKKKLKNIFKKIGKVQSVRFRSSPTETIKNQKKAPVKGKDIYHQSAHLTAYVVMSELESIKGALLLNGKEIEGHRIRVDNAQINGHDYKKSIFVGNLPYDIQEDEVWTFFHECGVIRNIRIIRDATLKIGKGFGYVLFDNEDSIILALEKNGQILNGRTLRIFPAKSEKKLNKKNNIGPISDDQAVGQRSGRGNKKPGKRFSRNFNFQGFGSKQGKEIKKKIMKKIRHPRLKKNINST